MGKMPASGDSSGATFQWMGGGAKVWGNAFYQSVPAYPAPAGKWGVHQEGGISLNLRSDEGVEFLGDFSVPLDPEKESPVNVVIQQLSLRVSPMDAVTVIAGKQRLNWGNAKIFSAIDILENRANPLDVRSVLSGVAGVKAVVIPNDQFSFSAAALPASELRRSRYAGRMDFVEENIGLDVGLGIVKYNFLDRDVPLGADPASIDRIAFTGDGAWSTGSLVLYGEGQLRWGRESGYQFPFMESFEGFSGKNRPVWRSAVGGMMQIEIGLTRPPMVLAEYCYNGDGLTGDESRLFAERYSSALRTGSLTGAKIPATFYGIGGFRRQYVSVTVQNLAVSRYLLVGASALVGLESSFIKLGTSIEWLPSQSLSVSLRYEDLGQSRDAKEEPSELLVIPFRRRGILTFTASF